jgi:hypothetical protein
MRITDGKAVTLQSRRLACRVRRLRWGLRLGSPRLRRLAWPQSVTTYSAMRGLLPSWSCEFDSRHPLHNARSTMKAPVKGRFRNAARLLHDSPARSGHYVGHWCGATNWPLEPQLSVCVEMRSGDDGPFFWLRVWSLTTRRPGTVLLDGLTRILCPDELATLLSVSSRRLRARAPRPRDRDGAKGL